MQELANYRARILTVILKKTTTNDFLPFNSICRVTFATIFADTISWRFLGDFTAISNLYAAVTQLLQCYILQSKSIFPHVFVRGNIFYGKSSVGIGIFSLKNGHV